MEKTYVAIDLKSFYASVECVERQLDPLNTNLVVADESRTEKTICLAVSPSLKSFGISGRARLFEVIQRVEQVNKERLQKAPKRQFSKKSYIYSELSDPACELDYIVATPQMAKYLAVSAKIYNVDGRGFAQMLILDVLKTTGITATAGVGTNMYLCKVAMDIVAKHIPADKNGVRIAELNEQLYKETLWGHTPITDFWRVGAGTASRLEKLGIYTMGDISRWSLDHYLIGKLYKVFGKNTELLIDHAWGIEPTAIPDVKSYRPSNNSISSGQVLQEPCNYERTRLILWEMADMLSLDLVDKGVVTNQIVLTVGYDKESLADGHYTGEVVCDHYGRKIPKHAHGTQNLGRHTSSTRKITDAAMALFDRIIDKTLLARRLNLTACNVIREEDIPEIESYEQISLFDMAEAANADNNAEEKERALQEAMLLIKHKYGKNAILKGTNYTEGATARVRNRSIGGHKA